MVHCIQQLAKCSHTQHREPNEGPYMIKLLYYCEETKEDGVRNDASVTTILLYIISVIVSYLMK